MQPLDYWPHHLPEPLHELERISKLPWVQTIGSLMLWLEKEDADQLISVFNPSRPELCGYSQSISQGLISKVFLTGIPMLENKMKEHADHDPHFDQKYQLQSQAMIAAPVSYKNNFIGVLSAVQFQGSAASYDSMDLQKLSSIAAQLSTALNA